jgi:hypothetical protein
MHLLTGEERSMSVSLDPSSTCVETTPEPVK